MKGVIFTEFIEMIENQLSPELADEILTQADLSTGGSYTAVGTYPHTEMLELVKLLSEKTEAPINELCCAFGEYLFSSFAEQYGEFFDQSSNAFDFLMQIEGHVHVEVLKLYPEAELPTFETRLVDEDTLEMTYRSKRPFADVALGLMRGCAKHFGEDILISEQEMSPQDRTHVQFTLKRR